MKMPRITIALLVVLLVIASVVIIQPVKAQSQSKTLIVPEQYSTIQAAINSASDGDKIFVRAGRYPENLVVGKAISLVGENPDRTIIAGEGNVGVLLRHDNVVVTGFKIIMINNVFYWHGVHLLSVKNCSVFKNKIENAYIGIWLYDASFNRVFLNEIKGNGNGISLGKSHNNTVAENTITQSYQWGIFNSGSNNNSFVGNYLTANDNAMTLNGYSETTSQNNLIYGNTIAQNPHQGIEITLSPYNSVIGNTITGNGNQGTGVGEGILIASSTQTLIRDNVISSNGIGIRLEASFNTITQNTIENNRQSGLANYYSFSAPAGNKIFANNIVNNNVSFSHSGANLWDENSKGNYWSAYNGIDEDGNGVGDTPYVINRAFSDNYPLMSPVNVNVPTVDLSSWLTMPVSGRFPALDTTAPKLVILSLNNTTVLDGNFSLMFTINESAPWIGYSLDVQDNVTIHGNLTLTELPVGHHNITVYAKDEAENTGISETIHFSVNEPVKIDEPFPVVPVAVASAFAVVLGSVLLAIVKAKKRKRNFW